MNAGDDFRQIGEKKIWGEGDDVPGVEAQPQAHAHTGHNLALRAAQP